MCDCEKLDTFLTVQDQGVLCYIALDVLLNVHSHVDSPQSLSC